MDPVDLSYSAAADAFDAVASRYDSTYGPGANQVMSLLRRESLSLLKSTYSPGACLLEIGCGTGDEALALARAGFRITATDVSPAMVSITKAKAAAAGLSASVSVAVVPAGKLGDFQPSDLFDGAYSSFGSLNCEPDITSLVSALADRLKPGSFFICSFMPQISPFEIAWFLLHGRPAVSLRRMRPGWQSAAVAGRGGDAARINIRYLSTRTVKRIFKPRFEHVRSLGLGLLFPPPYLNTLYRRRRPLWNTLALFEKRIRHYPPWNAMGDHIAVVFKKP